MLLSVSSVIATIALGSVFGGYPLLHSLSIAPTLPESTVIGRLSVRPHKMATGTENAKAGVQTLDSLPDYFVYVPESCVGKRRVPLVMYVHGGGWDSKMQLDAQRDLADKYGMILLLPNATAPGRWDLIGGYGDGGTKLVPKGWSFKVLQSPGGDLKKLDAALKQVLRKYAIDPDKIAVMGFSDGGSYSLFLGRNNLDIFSRVGGLSALIPFYGEGPKNDKAQFILSGGIEEDMVKTVLNVSEQLRKEGHPNVETVLALRGHIALREDDDYAWSWLKRSWAEPGTEMPAPPRVLSDSDPVLTVEALKQMTSFWASFMQEPDSVLTTARKANQEHIVMSIGRLPATVVKVNMIAMAAKYPSVAANLKDAGLTAEQEEAYRDAIIRVEFTRAAGIVAGFPADSSVLGKNILFRRAHGRELKELEKTGMWTTQ